MKKSSEIFPLNGIIISGVTVWYSPQLYTTFLFNCTVNRIHHQYLYPKVLIIGICGSACVVAFGVVPMIFSVQLHKLNIKLDNVQLVHRMFSLCNYKS